MQSMNFLPFRALRHLACGSIHDDKGLTLRPKHIEYYLEIVKYVNRTPKELL
jgi:hypothetical protein